MNRYELAAELQSLQKQRAWYIKTKNMVSNRLQATVAGTIGYHSGLKEAERAKLFTEAGKLVKRVACGEEDSDHKPLILTTQMAIDGFEEMRKSIETQMKSVAKELPVHDWVEHEQQRGFGTLFLAIVIGETGDLANYANPGKVWRRMGCAPWTKNDETLMGATWRGRSKSKTQTKLHAADWEEYGYSPRRRSISYLIGDGIVKNNKSIYRERYETKKAELQEKHPDYNKMRCHLHGMLLATKLLLKNLWLEWNPDLRRDDDEAENENLPVAAEV